MRNKITYPMGSVSSGTMRPEDLIPAFANELEHLLKHTRVSKDQRKRHTALLREINKAIADADELEPSDEYYDGAESDLESLFDALGEYAGPYFYFGAHPGDGADYGFWLSEDWDRDFQTREQWFGGLQIGINPNDAPLKVNDLSEVPAKFRGEVAHVNDHGNVTLYVKTLRGFREIWAVV